MSQVAAANKSKTLADSDLAFWVQAGNEQMEECCKAWGVPFEPIGLYRSTEELVGNEIRVALFVDELPEAPSAAAYHSVGPDGKAYSRMIASYGPSAFGHENCEEAIDTDCSKQVRRPDGKTIDVEICDPVQSEVRKRQVTVLGEAREVEESNYVLPSWFDPVGVAPFDAFGTCTRPFEVRPGGYCNVDGVAVFAEGDEVARQAVEAKKADPGSRMARRLRG
jgi:hypothetical protein